MISNRYYYKTVGVNNDTCTEICNIREGYGIGSVACQVCLHNMSFNTDEGWIECNKIAQATGVLKD